MDVSDISEVQNCIRPGWHTCDSGDRGKHGREHDRSCVGRCGHAEGHAEDQRCRHRVIEHDNTRGRTGEHFVDFGNQVRADEL